jgi:hopanoid biosynthesis associated RND transporter like protein HpnN
LTAITLAYALGITFGIVTITIGYLNLLSIVFAIMMISLGTEFGIHVIARYHEEFTRCKDLKEALHHTIVTTGRGNFTGAVTTAAAFYSTFFVHFKGLAELGFIAGTGVLVCMLAMNSLLPAFLLVIDRWRPPRHRAAPLRMTAFGVFARHPWPTLATAMVLLVVALPFFADRHFDSNLLDLQADGLSSVEYEKKVIENRGMKTWYAAYLTDRSGVRGLVERLSSEGYAGIIGGVESVLDYVPDDQDEKLRRIRAMAAQLGAEPAAAEGRAWPPVESAPDISRLRDALENLLDRLDTALSAAARRDGQASEFLVRLTDALDRLLGKLEEDPNGVRPYLGTLQVNAFAEVRSWLGKFLNLLDPRPLSLDDLDPTIVKRIHSPSTGDYLVYAYPVKDIWQPQNLAEFVQVTHEVSPEVTGLPEQIYQSTEIMKRGFFLAAIYSFVAVFVLIWLDFRSLLYTLLALLPVVLGIVGTIAVLPVFGMTLNLANFFSVPIIIGAGINGGVHMIHRYREDSRAHVVTGSTGTAVVLSALTNMTGFGMLLLAHHRGIVSLGGVMVLGAAGCLLASMVVLPAVLRLLQRRFLQKTAARHS